MQAFGGRFPHGDPYMRESREFNWWNSAPSPFRYGWGGFGDYDGPGIGGFDGIDGYHDGMNRGGYNYRPSRAYSYGPYRGGYGPDFLDEFGEPGFGMHGGYGFDDLDGPFGRFNHSA